MEESSYVAIYYNAKYQYFKSIFHPFETYVFVVSPSSKLTIDTKINFENVHITLPLFC